VTEKDQKRLPANSNLRFWLARHFTWFLSLACVIFATVIVTQFPVYFRADDVYYLKWAHAHDYVLHSIMPSQAILMGMFRPVQNIAWWLLYHAFGLNPLPYHFFIVLLYGFSFLFYFKLIELVFSVRVACFSLLAYFSIFFYLIYIIFWFSDLTYVIELFFINLSLFLLIRTVKKGGSYIWGILGYLCAALSKEPAILIVPAVFSSYVFTQWKDLDPDRRKPGGVAAGTLMSLAALAIMFHPYIRSRQGLNFSLGWSSIAEFVAERWDFYAGYLFSELGLVILLGAFLLALMELSRKEPSPDPKWFHIILSVSVILSLILKRFHAIALIALVIAFVPLWIKRSKLSSAAVWFLLPLLGVMTISYMVRTYLIEASFGISIIVGCALSEITKQGWLQLRRWQFGFASVAVPVVLVFLLLLGTMGIASKIQSKLEALHLLSASRQNCRSAVEFFSSHPDAASNTLIVIDYEDMGLNYVRDILPLDDKTKAKRQKSLLSHELGELLQLAGKNYLTVHNLEWFLSSSATDRGSLLVMNNFERDFIEQLPLKKEIQYESGKCGEGAWLYSVTK
jgi:hypothetical protein